MELRSTSKGQDSEWNKSSFDAAEINLRELKIILKGHPDAP